MYISWNEFKVEFECEMGTGRCLYGVRSEMTTVAPSNRAGDCAIHLTHRRMQDQTHLQTAGTPGSQAFQLGDQNQAEGPMPKAARTLDFGALSHVLGLRSRKVVSNIATATTRSRRRVQDDKQLCSHRRTAVTLSSTKDAGLIRIMLVLGLDGPDQESFLVPEFRPLCSSLAGWCS